MKDLDAVLAAWKEDSVINNNDLAETSRQTPQLHSKYLSALSNTKLRYRQAEMEQKKLLKLKFLYYNGKMSEEDIKAHGWEFDPFNGLKIMKGEMDYYYDSDPEIQASELKLQYLKTMIDTLSEIVDNLKWRHQTIGNMIKWRQFEAGN